MTEPPHAYPRDLAAYARERWPTEIEPPPVHLLATLLSTAYHASFLRDEDRPVRFRLMLIEPESLSEADAPPTGLLRLEFDRPRLFHEHELRRLSPAVKYHRALIGVAARDGALVVWGIIQSGPRWLQMAQGGRALETPLPSAPVIRVSRPGHVAVACGSRAIAELANGRLVDVEVNVFESRWLPERFAEVRAEFLAAHLACAHAAAGPVDPDVIRSIGQQLVKRITSIMRSAHHGGTILFLPTVCASGIASGQYLRLKYTFAGAPPRERYRELLLAVLGVLSGLDGERGAAAGWDVYRRSAQSCLVELDEAILEFGHLIAALAEVDGAVVLTKRFEVLGFGAEITGDLPDVTTVQRALDLEGVRRKPEVVDGVGTRHRSAYRLCALFHDAVAVVVSQDGGVRFVTWHNDHVTYWDHAGLGEG